MFQSMRFKILCGYIIIAILLLAYGMFAFYHLGFLQRSVNIVLEENYQSIVSATNMIELIERMDSALWSEFSEHPFGVKEFQSFQTAFMTAYDKAKSNITVLGEEIILDAIMVEHQSYVQKIKAIFELTERPQKLAVFVGEVQPIFTTLKQKLQSLLFLNQNHMYEIERESRNRAHQSIIAGIVTSLLTIVLGIIFAVLIGNAVVKPIRVAIQELETETLEYDETQIPAATGYKEIDQLLSAVKKHLEKGRNA